MNSLSVEADPQRLAYTWDWSREEHVRLLKALTREVRSRGLSRILRTGFYLAMGTAVLILLLNAFQGDVTPLLSALPWILMIAAWLVLFTWLSRRSAVRAFEKLHQGPLWLALTPEAVETGCDITSTRLHWSTFKRAVETPEFFLLFYTTHCACFLPKRVLEPPAEQDRVRIALRRYLPEQATFTASK